MKTLKELLVEFEDNFIRTFDIYERSNKDMFFKGLAVAWQEAADKIQKEIEKTKIKIEKDVPFLKKLSNFAEWYFKRH